MITGSASGIGNETAALLRERGHRVVGVDLRDAEVIADLADSGDRESLGERVREQVGASVDGVIACAGLAAQSVGTVAVNYWGALATLEGLRPLLVESGAPRAVAVSSAAALYPPDAALYDALSAGDEPASLARGAELEAVPTRQIPNPVYGTTKRALAHWVRRAAPSAEWAGAGIALNAVAPGIVSTPMTAAALDSAPVRADLVAKVPMPLGGISSPRSIAYLLAWLTSEENTVLCGQIIFVDGGADAVIRGDRSL